MKKFLKSLAACGLLVCISATSIGVVELIGAKAIDLSGFTDTTIAYNEVYSLKTQDDSGRKLSYSVKTSAGNDVPIYNYAFAVTEMDAYTVTVSCGNKTKTYQLIPKDISAPILHVEKNQNRLNVLNGEKVMYPRVIVTDNVDTEIELVYEITYNGETYASENDGFTPSALGFYTLTITAKDDANNIATKTVVYESVATEEETYKVFAFDENAIHYFDYLGLEHSENPILSYNTDQKYVYGEEKGSTRMSFVAQGTPLFVVKNPMIDTSEFDYIRFYVYNNGDSFIGLGVNLTSKMYRLEPGTWTEIVIDAWECSTTPNMNHSDITGMCFMFWKGGSEYERFGYSGDLYFSAAYGVKE